MKFLRVLLVVLSVLIVSGLNAQFDPNNTPAGFNFDGIIKGTVIDSVTKQPVEYAAVSAIAMRDSSIAGGMVTDEKGEFKIDKLKPGRYFLKIKFIGYSEKIVRGIVLKPDQPVYNATTVFLSPATANLDEVEIVHTTEVMEANLDKRVINVEKDLTSTGGTALDVMKNVPSVQVDVDNNVSLRGNSNVRILIDGRVTSLDPATMLQQIPASMVKQIEVITNPSAKYDPDGVSGIINIITKKEQRPGFNGLITAGVGTGSKKVGGGAENFDVNKYNFNSSLNYQTGKFNFFGSYDGRYGKVWNRGDTYRELYVNDSFTDVLTQFNARMRPGYNHNGKLGMDVNLTDNDLLSVSGNLRREDNTSFEEFNYDSESGSGEFLNHFNRLVDETQYEKSYDGNLNYKHKFKEKGHELVFDASMSSSENEKFNVISENYFNANGDQYATDSIYEELTNFHSRDLYSAQLDYVNPTEKYGRFEMGGKYLGRRNGQNVLTMSNMMTGDIMVDTNRTNAFNYQEDIFSAYFIYGNMIKKFKYQFGLRFEQAFTESYQVTLNQRFERDFYNFFPSAHLKYELKKGGEFGLSYSRRISRPSNQQLNPYPDYSDKLNYRVGNPYLKPEFVDSYEFSYGKFDRKLTYTASLFYRHTTNNFFRVKNIDNLSGISVITFSNLSESHSTGLEGTINASITKWMRVNGNVSVFHYKLMASPEHGLQGNENISYTTRGSLNFTLSKSLEFQLTGSYRGPQVAPQGIMDPMYNLDMGLRYDFMKKRASLNFKVSDIFNTQQFSIDASDFNYYSEMTHKRETRVANLTFTYKINQGEMKREKPKGEREGMDMGL